MNISSMPSNFANAISPFNPLGKQAVGQEETDAKESTLKPIEQPADIFRAHQKIDDQEENQEGADQKKNEQQSENRLTSYSVGAGADDSSDSIVNDAENNVPNNAEKETFEKAEAEKREKNQAAEKQQVEQDRLMIQELAARDREVRTHERAHAAVGGQYAGAPTYTYQRGPDGVNYAIGGEVKISTSKIPGDPQATIDKAQQVRRAALAPAEPSPQDRRVAASASQMEMEAKQELVQLQRKEAEEEKAIREKSFEESGGAEKTENQSAAAQSVERSDKAFDLPSETLIAQASQFAGSQIQSANFANAQELHSHHPKQTGATHADLFAGTVVNTHA